MTSNICSQKVITQDQAARIIQSGFRSFQDKNFNLDYLDNKFSSNKSLSAGYRVPLLIKELDLNVEENEKFIRKIICSWQVFCSDKKRDRIISETSSILNLIKEFVDFSLSFFKSGHYCLSIASDLEAQVQAISISRRVRQTASWHLDALVSSPINRLKNQAKGHIKGAAALLISNVVMKSYRVKRVGIEDCQRTSCYVDPLDETFYEYIGFEPSQSKKDQYVLKGEKLRRFMRTYGGRGTQDLPQS